MHKVSIIVCVAVLCILVLNVSEAKKGDRKDRRSKKSECVYLKQKKRECVDGQVTITKEVDTVKSKSETNCKDIIKETNRECGGGNMAKKKKCVYSKKQKSCIDGQVTHTKTVDEINSDPMLNCTDKIIPTKIPCKDRKKSKHGEKKRKTRSCVYVSKKECINGIKNIVQTLDTAKSHNDSNCPPNKKFNTHRICKAGKYKKNKKNRCVYLKEKQRECVDGLLKIIRPVDTAKSSPEANCTDRVISKQKKCQENAVVLDKICSMPKVIGYCRASITKWYYDPALNDCKEFIYGGCRGNENNFKTKEECQERCPSLG